MGKKRLNFWDAEYFIERKERITNLEFSKEFIDIASKKLERNFKSKTGIKSRGNVIIELPSAFFKDKFSYSSGDVSKIQWALILYDYFYPVEINWSSKSGRIYVPSDIDIEESDIIFWFEDLDAIKVHEILYPTIQNPLKLDSLHFDLNIKSMNQNLIIDIEPNIVGDLILLNIENMVIRVFQKWNEKALKDSNDKLGLGLIHSWSFHKENNLEIRVDMGSADVTVLKKLLLELDTLDTIKAINIE